MDYRISTRMQNARGSIIRDLLKLASEPGMISFGGGAPSPLTFPVLELTRSLVSQMQTNAKTLLSYGISEGFPPLRQTMRDYLAKNEQIDMADNELYILSGGQQCADLVSKTLINEGDTVICEEPAFVGCLNAFRSYGARLKGVPITPDGVDLVALERAFLQEKNISFFYTIPTFQNPTGYTYSRQKRDAVYALARQYGVMIFEDNPYGELRFSGEWLAPIKAQDQDGRVLYAGNFSKTIAPGLRLAPLVMPKGLADRIKIAKQAADVHASTIHQAIVNEYVNSAGYEDHLKAARALYRDRMALMAEQMEEHFHPKVVFHRPEGGLFLLARLPGVDTVPFAKEAIKRGVIVVPGSAFATDPDQENDTIRLNFSLPNEEQIKKGIAILGQMTHEYLG